MNISHLFSIPDVSERIVSFLNVPDILALSSTCHELYDLKNVMCHEMFRIRMTFADAMKLYHRSQTKCGHVVHVGETSYACVNAPTTITTECIECESEMVICDICAIHTHEGVRYCEFCNCRYGTCISCADMNGDYERIVFHECSNCAMVGCRWHLRNGLCKQCIPKRVKEVE